MNHMANSVGILIWSALILFIANISRIRYKALVLH